MTTKEWTQNPLKNKKGNLGKLISQRRKYNRKIKYFELSENITQTSWDVKAMFIWKFIALNTYIDDESLIMKCSRPDLGCF